MTTPIIGSLIGQGLAKQQSEQKQQSDNTPNWATSYGKYRTTGFGVMVPELNFDFDSPFEQEPYYTWGARIFAPPPSATTSGGTGDGSTNPTLTFASDAHAAPPATGSLPMLCAACWGFVRDPKTGLYTAAKVYFRVDFGASNPAALGKLQQVSINWTLAFAGPSHKAVPDAEATARTDSQNSLATAIDVT